MPSFFSISAASAASPQIKREFVIPFISALTFAEGEFIHEKGKITTRWERTDEAIRLRICLPYGIRARLVLPQNYESDCLVKRDDCATRNVYPLFDNGKEGTTQVYDVVCRKITE